MDSEYTKWLSQLPLTEKSGSSSSKISTLHDGLVLDLQVVQADLFGLQGSLSSIAKRLQELEVLVSEHCSHQQEWT